ncbi:NAD(P)H-dependent oxidoreductase [Helicobacter sp. 13S00401-1]|uniref:NAD(P)H-dependent oxidoreductase n=1 Tax=Helicobacter sp. 13S00401-1 TaxID=1905758 RepID=UPI000BA7C71B|nr:NAD(P)H-dependent oxidoreductase [Helicobacter sp. 13S00401-1]PAF51782.1 NAD(P)H-dependent oxidoreductase [Helicobacter sp. 13S00401-1]
MKDGFMKALDFRHACKVFDNKKHIPQEEFYKILEAGRLSPSSLGFEPTRLLVIKDKELRAALRKACWDQPQITDASEIVVFKSFKCEMLPESNYILRQGMRRVGGDKEKFAQLKAHYKSFLEANNYVDDDIKNWTARQAYIMASTMVNYAAFLKIDTCYLEGFVKKDVESLLDIDTFKEQVSLIVAFGYRKNEGTPKLRISLDELVKTL